MISLSRTNDMELIKNILLHPKIYPHIHDDGTTGCDPAYHPDIYWMLVTDEDPVGAFMIHPSTSTCFEIHTCLMPVIWGKKAKIAASLVLDWAFDTLCCSKLITRVPAYNMAALRFAKSAGFQIEGINRESYMHCGKLEDQIMLGITKGEWKCLH